ncbi:MAG: hypothetical protein FWD88_00575, partial [Treponema sp.]|nr:hypothetical protein [Treponema sp.]
MTKILHLPINTNYSVNQAFDWNGLQILYISEKNKTQIIDAGGYILGYTLTSNPENGYSVGLIPGERIVTVSVGHNGETETVDFPIQVSEIELVYPLASPIQIGIIPASESIMPLNDTIGVHNHSSAATGGLLPVTSIPTH